jgi:glyoxylase-like metal-dependent hydrolase (beta-lactamase superfamily II)
VLKDDAGTEVLLGQGLWCLPLRTPTLPPATTTNTLVVAGEDGVAVIEPGCPDEEDQRDLRERLDSLERAGKPLKWIVLTHQHIDHVGGAEALRRARGGRIVAHAETAARLSFGVDLEVDEGDAIDLGHTRLEFLFTPGHAPGHLAVWMPGHRIAHGGDLVAAEGTILVDLRDGGDMRVYLDTLRRMVDLFRGPWAGASLVPAHGAVVRDPAALCEHYISHRLGREKKVLAAIGERATPIDAVLAAAYADKDPSILPLARFALDAHVAKLVDEGRVLRVGDALRVAIS